MQKPWVGLGFVVMIGGCPGGGPGSNRVCYPGAAFDYDACFVLVPASQVNDADYDYPDPLAGSIQYSRPVRYLDLLAIDGGRPVAPNFTLRELAQSSKGQYAVVQVHAVERLQDIRDDVGILGINSGYRSPGYNATVPNSATYSRHTYGDAFDLDPAQTSLNALNDACKANGAGFTKVYPTHIHCDWRDDAMDVDFYGNPSGPTAAPEVTTAYRVGPGESGAPGRLIDPAEEESGWIVAVGDHLEAPALGWPEGEPLRDWTAFDVDGRVIAEHQGATFTPPPGASRVEVLVGLNLRLTYAVP